MGCDRDGGEVSAVPRVRGMVMVVGGAPGGVGGWWVGGRKVSFAGSGVRCGDAFAHAPTYIQDRWRRLKTTIVVAPQRLRRNFIMY